MKKELKTTEPIIRNYQRDAYPIMVMAANSQEYLPWVYSNFVQIMMNMEEYKEQNWYRVMYCNQYTGFQSPFLETMKLKRSYLQLFNFDICEFIRNNINNEFYIMLSIDNYYMPNSASYLKWHNYHDTLIYGYDSDSFKLIGYFKNNKFETTTIDFESFVKAYNGLKVTYNWWNDVIYIFKYKENVKYDFNKVLFKGLLTDYLYGRNTAAHTQEELAQIHKDIFVFGVDVYSYYKEYLKSLLDGNEYYDLTPIHMFAEHKHILGLAIEFMENNKIILPDESIYKLYKVNVIDKFDLFLCLFIKADITKNVKYIKKIFEAFDDVIQMEKKILHHLSELL